jgi:fibronectin type 3 domain-containing protein
MRHRSLIFLIILTFVLLVNAGLAQNNSEQTHNSHSSTDSSQKLFEGFSSLFGNKFLSAVLPQEKRISARGDFLVSIVEIIDPRTGQIIGSRTDRIVVINGVTYKAVVFGRRAEMPSKRNIPIQGVLAGDTIILDESPVRIVSSAELSALGVDQSKISGDTIPADIGGQIAYFPNKLELDKFVNQQIAWEMKIGPVKPSEAKSDVEERPWTEGAKTFLFMRVDFSDRPGDPVSEGAALDVMNNSVNPFYVSNSYGKTSLQTTVTPVLRMPKPLSEYVQSYNQSSGTGLNLILNDARTVARAAGFETNNFSLDGVAASRSLDVSFAGVAWVGDKGLWLNGFFDLRVTAHELGHNYGLRHANLWDPTDSDPIGPGTNVEYGDCYDNMGNGNSADGCFSQSPSLHFNARYKRNLDWLTDADIQTVTTNGTYRIIAQDSSSTGFRAIRITKDSSKDYWIEFRQLITTNSNALNGALIRWDFTNGTLPGGITNRQTQLLDMNPNTTSTSDAPLLPNQSFFDGIAGIKITVLGKGNTSPESLDVKVEFNVFTNPPNPPTNLRTTSVSSSQVNLAWNASVNPNATSYDVRINGTQVITGITSLSYLVSNLAQNTQYTFEVRAVNSFGPSNWSTPINVTTSRTVPSAPKNVTTQVVSPNQINVFWDQNPANELVTSYNLRVNGVVVATNLTYLSYPVKNLTPDTTYTFEVQAVNSLGSSNWSTPVSAKTESLTPNPPAKVNPIPVSQTQINVFWDASTSSNVQSYNLRINGSTVISGLTYLSYPVKDLTPNTTYTFEVQTVSSTGISAWSTPVQATTLGPTPPPNAPAGVTTSVVSSSQINVFWNPSNSQNVTSYNLRVNGTEVITGITYLSYPVKNLTPGTTYTFEVQAVNSSGAASAWSTPVQATTTPIAVPTGVVANSVSQTQINVFWNASSSPNVTSYNLRINGSTVVNGITYLSYPVKNLTPNTTYTFEVQAVTSDGFTSNWSSPVQATTQPVAPPPAPPTNVVTQSVSTSQINVFWNASASSDVTSYNLRVNGTDVITGITYLSYPVKNLNPNTTYTFEVQAVSASGVSNWTTPVQGTTQPLAPPPAPPSNVVPQVVSSSQINLFWNASASQDVTSYNLRVNGSIVITGITYLSYPVNNLTPNTTYTFEVQAVSSNGVSTWTTPVQATTQPAAPPPSVPLNLVTQVVSQSQINLFWNQNPASENVTSYNLRVNGENIITGITYLSYPVKNLTANTTYTFEVQAVNANGTSSWSSLVSATTSAALSTPTIAAAQTVSASQINVFWNGPQQGETVTSYNLRINGGTVITGITYLSYPVKNLNPNTTYTFEVQATGPSGNSNWSAPAQATTAP